MEYITESPRKTRIRASCDVLFAGGGAAGITTALAAAENGASVVLIERSPYLGGVMINGLRYYTVFSICLACSPTLARCSLSAGFLSGLLAE